MDEKIDEIIDSLPNLKYLPDNRTWCYQISFTGEVKKILYENHPQQHLAYEFGNLFKTEEEASSMRDKIKKILNNRDN